MPTLNHLSDASFSRAAPRYLRSARVQDDMAAWLAEWRPISTEGTALEVGAGPGLFTRQMLPWAGRYVATDRSAEMCAEGRSAYPGLEWQVMSAELPLTGPWSWIFSSSMLQWVDDPAAVLKMWRQVLAPDGRILAGFFVEGSLKELRQTMGDWSPLTWRSPEFWEEAILRAGLCLERGESLERICWHDSALSLLQGLHGVGAAPIRRYSQGELRSLLKRHEMNFREGDGLRSTWRFYRFEATL